MNHCIRSQSAARSKRQIVRTFIAASAVLCAVFGTLTAMSTDAGAATTRSIPTSANYWKSVAKFNAYGNITSNDCSLAAIGALQQVWQKAVGDRSVNLSSQAIIKTYRSAVHGRDTGMLPAQAFAAWESGIDDLHIDSVASLSVSRNAIEHAVYGLGGIFAVINITNNDKQHPNVATSMSATVAPWSLTEAVHRGAVRTTRHAVAVVGYDSSYVYFATWGSIQRATWSWWNARAVQAWTLLPDAYFTNGHGPVSSLGSIVQTYFTSTLSREQNGPYEN